MIRLQSRAFGGQSLEMGGAWKERVHDVEQLSVLDFHFHQALSIAPPLKNPPRGPSTEARQALRWNGITVPPMQCEAQASISVRRFTSAVPRRYVCSTALATACAPILEGPGGGEDQANTRGINSKAQADTGSKRLQKSGSDDHRGPPPWF